MYACGAREGGRERERRGRGGRDRQRCVARRARGGRGRPGANPKNDDDDDNDDARARTRRDETHGFVRAAALGRGGLKGASGRGACALRQRATRDLGESSGRHLARGKCAPSRAISWHERHEPYTYVYSLYNVRVQLRVQLLRKYNYEGTKVLEKVRRYEPDE